MPPEDNIKSGSNLSMTPDEQFEWLKLARSLAAMSDYMAERVVVTFPLEERAYLVSALERLLKEIDENHDRTDWWPFVVHSCLMRRLNYLRQE